eukprot:1141400-Pelagomonas_calceolata.AAC.1
MSDSRKKYTSAFPRYVQRSREEHYFKNGTSYYRLSGPGYPDRSTPYMARLLDGSRTLSYLTKGPHGTFKLDCKEKKRKEKERKGKERKGKERKGKERKGKERKGKERKGKERKGKERKGKKNYAGVKTLPTSIKEKRIPRAKA